jgi:hypothetical protein
MCASSSIPHRNTCDLLQFHWQPSPYIYPVIFFSGNYTLSKDDVNFWSLSCQLTLESPGASIHPPKARNWSWGRLFYNEVTVVRVKTDFQVTETSKSRIRQKIIFRHGNKQAVLNTICIANIIHSYIRGMSTAIRFRIVFPSLL